MKKLTLITLAFKNLSRYRRRTVITALSLALGLLVFILIHSLLIGAEKESDYNLKWYETADIKIFNRAFYSEKELNPIELNIKESQKIVTLLEQNHYKATKRITFNAEMILNENDFEQAGSLVVEITAVDLDQDKTVFKNREHLIAGRDLKKGSEEILLGAYLADDIEAEIGNHITLLFQGSGGFYEALDVEIVGILDIPNPNVNRSLVMIDYNLATEYLELENSATEIAITLNRNQKIEKEIFNVQNLLKEDETLVAVGYKELASDYVYLAQAKRSGSAMILFLVFVIAAVGISNTMLMTIYERINEIAMMRSLGMKDLDIRLIFLLEGSFIALFGALIGTFVALILNYFLVTKGLNFGFMMREIDIGYRLQSHLRGAWSFSSIGFSFLFSTILAVGFTLIFINRALKMELFSMMRHN